VPLIFPRSSFELLLSFPHPAPAGSPAPHRQQLTPGAAAAADAWALNDGKQWEPYGFHDFRRIFATVNADGLSQDVLQQLMRHRSAATTALYIALSKQRRLSSSTELLSVPDFLKSPSEV
jgi:integrase